MHIYFSHVWFSFAKTWMYQAAVLHSSKPVVNQLGNRVEMSFFFTIFDLLKYRVMAWGEGVMGYYLHKPKGGSPRVSAGNIPSRPKPTP